MTLNQRHTPVASSNQVTSSFNFSAAVPYPQEPVYKDAQLSCQDAPPSYFDATAYPAIDAQQAAAQVHVRYATSDYRAVVHANLIVQITGSSTDNLVLGLLHS